ncbi:MAG: hypothetical protein QME66_03590 [Candidatus Eisenbacteria bacterium]|nr:hypothetical protein [Candidatus Eisenbacteria bacterium]
MRKTLLIHFTAAALLFSGYAHAITLHEVHGEYSGPEEQVLADSLLANGMRHHDVAARGRAPDDIIKAEQCLSRVLEIEPDNAIAMVYFGSLHTIIARDRAPFWKKMGYMKKGFKYMDKAVRLDPDNYHVRMVRAINSATVPKMFKRRRIAEQDFKHIDKLTRKEGFDAPISFWLSYLYHYGLLLEDAGDISEARLRYARVIATDPGSDYAAKARLRLKGGKADNEYPVSSQNR